MNTVTLLATIPAILALTNLSKKLGVPTKWATLLAVVLGVGLNVTDFYLTGLGWYQAAAQGLILGLSAAGLYDVAATVGNPTIALPEEPPEYTDEQMERLLNAIETMDESE
jgi:hypothetical protein